MAPDYLQILPSSPPLVPAIDRTVQRKLLGIKSDDPIHFKMSFDVKVNFNHKYE